MLSHLWNDSRLGRIKSAAWLLFLLILVSLPALSVPVPVMLRYNAAVVHLAKNVVKSDSNPILVRLEPKLSQSLSHEFQQVQDEMSNDLRARYHLGQLAFWSGDYGETIRQLSPRLGGSSSPLAKLLLGYALWNSGRTDEAVATWRPAPNIRYYLLHQAAKAESDRNYESAENIYRITMALAPDWAATEAGYWFAHSMNLLQEEDHDPDEVDWVVEQYLGLNDPGRPRRLTELGMALLYQRKLELAKVSLMLGIQLEPNSHWPRYYLGLVYYKKQEYRSAEERLVETVEIAPDYARGHHWLARTLIQLGRSEEALIHYREAVRLLPEDQELADELKALEARLQQE